MKKAKNILPALLLTAFLGINAHAVRPPAATYQPKQRAAVAKTLAATAKTSINKTIINSAGKKAAFAAKYGSQWKVRYNKATGLPETVAGGTTGKIAGTPGKAARSFVEQNAGFLGIDAAAITEKDMQSRGGKNHVRYQQTYEGVPVEDAWVAVHLTGNNEVLALNSRYKPGIAVNVTPDVTASAALATVKSAMGLTGDVKNLETCLVVYTTDDNDYVLCWKVRFFADKPLGDWVHYVDAHTGAIVSGFNNLRFSTSGTVTGYIFPQYGTDTVRAETFPHEYVTVAGATASTGDDGSYTSSNSGTITSSLEGPWAHVVNCLVYDASHTGTDPSWTWDYGATSTHFDEQHAFYHVNRIHDYFKNTFGFTGADTQMTTYVHYYETYGVGYCNAFSYGTVLAFGDGDGSTYNDFAREAGVVYHEYTHTVQNLIYYIPYWGQSGAMMEAWADYFGASIFDEPVMGSYVCPSSPFRTIDNTYTLAANWTGEVHDDSQIYSGALWDLRKTVGRTVCDQLTFGSLYYYPDDFKSGLEAMLLADDDDGNLSNGTPHQTAINSAFSAHGITTSISTGTWTWEEQNDDLGTAYGPLTSGATYYPFINNDADYDYFKIYANAGKIYVSLTSIPASGTVCDYDLYLMSSDGSVIGSSERTGAQNEWISTTTVAAGTYYIMVYSYNGSYSTTDSYDLSATFTQKTGGPSGKPSTPLASGSYGTSPLLFTWTSGTCDQVKGYYLEVGTTVGGSDFYAGDVGNVLSMKIDGAQAGKTYYARVRAYNESSIYSSWSSNSAGITVDATAPAGTASVPARKAMGSDKTVAKFTWAKNTAADTESGIAGYWLQVSTAADAAIVNMAFDGDVGNVLEKTLYGLDSTKEYYARVRPVNGAGTVGAWSVWSSSNTTPDVTGVASVVAYPNPCHPAQDSYVRFALSSNDDITIYIYTLAGELVRTLANGDGIEEVSGNRLGKWDGRNESNEKVASGAYLCLIKNKNGDKKIEKVAIFW